MLTKFLSHLRQQYAGFLALFIALGGTSYAVATGSIDSREIKNNTIASKDIRNNQVASVDVKNASLLAADFRAGQLPAGARGPQGAQGAQGPQGVPGAKGDTGTVDTSNFYTKTASDERFLGVGAKAADADKLDGKDSSAFLGSQKLRSASVNADGTTARNDGFGAIGHLFSNCDRSGGTDRSCTGTYFVYLTGDVSPMDCSLSAMVGRTGFAQSIETQLSSIPGIATANPHNGQAGGFVVVTTRTMAGTPQDLPFHLIAAC